MKAKTINAIISRKFDQWKDSLDSEALKTQVRMGTICTGGSIASMLLNEKVNDFDFYFRDYSTALAVAQYYVDKFKAAKAGREHIKLISSGIPGDRIEIRVQSAGVASENDENVYDNALELAKEEKEEIAKIMDEGEELLSPLDVDKTEKKDEKPKYRPVFLSPNAISLSNDIQLVIRFYGEPDQIHETYDFDHVKSYWTSWDRNLVLRPEALEAILARELRYSGSKYPLCTLFRVKKFVERGWHCNAGTILKIVWNLRDYDLSKIDVLSDQLTGVDTTFMMQLIEGLKQRNEEQRLKGVPTNTVDSAYLMELINKLF